MAGYTTHLHHSEHLQHLNATSITKLLSRIVAFLSGLAHITLPVPAYGNSTLDEAWVVGGANGLIIAVDVVGSGHITTYPSDQATVALQVPLESEEALPAHGVVALGPCHYSSGSGQLQM